MNTDFQVGVILLGASEYVNSKSFQSSSAFQNSYEKIKKYFTSGRFHGLYSEGVLDLFNTNKSPSYIDEELREFLSKSAENELLTDLVIVYIGHGGFDAQRGFVLALKETRDENIGISGLRFADLSLCTQAYSSKLRVYFIIDCCFSAESVKGFDFQSSSNDFIKQQFSDSFPLSGTSLLCSSSNLLPSLIVRERNITMFTEALSEALSSGDQDVNSKYITLKQLRDITFRFIRRLNPENFVRPEVHSPVQNNGDIAQFVPLFPNYGAIQKPFNLRERAHEIQKLLSYNEFVAALDHLMEYVREFSNSDILLDKAIILAADSKDLENNAKSLERKEYLNERRGYIQIALDILKTVQLQD